jgi:hypothetical protein
VLAVVCAAAPLLAPAHVSLYDYKFPLPPWLFLTGSALAVLLFAPAALFAVADRRDRTTGSSTGSWPERGHSMWSKRSGRLSL